MTDPVPVARVGSRVLLIDDSGRVLLIHEAFDSYDEHRTHWLTPGGGIEPGEDLRFAAAREVYEETGIELELADDAPEVLTTRRLWNWRDNWFDQVDHFFVARVPDGLPVEPQGLTDVEVQTLRGHRWWTVAELRSTSEVILPAELADVLERVLSSDGGAK